MHFSSKMLGAVKEIFEALWYRFSIKPFFFLIKKKKGKQEEIQKGRDKGVKCEKVDANGNLEND